MGILYNKTDCLMGNLSDRIDIYTSEMIYV